MRFLRHLAPAAVLIGLIVPAMAVAGPDDKRPATDKAPAEKGPPAAAAYSAEVLVLHATNGDKGIDARIGDMPELKKPPFSSYKSYELLQKVRHPLDKERPRTLELPNGRVLQTKLLEVLPEDNVRFTASINQPGGKTFLPLLEVKAKQGQSFIVAGQGYKGGILVLVIRIVK
jgi:hypothetical protein